MATIGAKGAASVYAMGPMNGNDSLGDHMNLSTPAGWHTIWWWLAVAIIVFFLWAL